MFSSDLQLSRETYVKGATCSMDESVKDMLSKEGIDPNFVDITKHDVFVLSSA